MNWTDLITYLIVLAAIAYSIYMLIRKFAPKANEDVGCDSCSTSACGSCGIADLKKDLPNSKLH